jgi:hypothetical protein
MGFHFAQVVAELIEGVGMLGDTEARQKNLVNMACGPAVDLGAGVLEDFHQADHACVMNLDARDASGSLLDGVSQTLQKRKVGMHVQRFGLKGSEAVADCLKALPHIMEMLRPFFKAEIAQVVRAELVAQESGELLVLFEECVFAVGAENVMLVVDSVQDSVKLATRSFGQAYAEDLVDLLVADAPETDFAGAFEDFADREGGLEDKVATVFDLGQGVNPVQVHLCCSRRKNLGSAPGSNTPVACG